jgi:hypothetical protein
MISRAGFVPYGVSAQCKIRRIAHGGRVRVRPFHFFSNGYLMLEVGKWDCNGEGYCEAENGAMRRITVEHLPRICMRERLKEEGARKTCPLIDPTQ